MCRCHLIGSFGVPSELSGQEFIILSLASIISAEQFTGSLILILTCKCCVFLFLDSFKIFSSFYFMLIGFCNMATPFSATDSGRASGTLTVFLPHSSLHIPLLFMFFGSDTYCGFILQSSTCVSVSSNSLVRHSTALFILVVTFFNSKSYSSVHTEFLSPYSNHSLAILLSLYFNSLLILSFVKNIYNSIFFFLC